MGIYIVSHKKINQNFPNGYNTIIVNATKNTIIGDAYDNTGDNISSKNNSYCELTAIYWLWKNCQDDYIGIDHYRRFFIDNEKQLLNATKAADIVRNGTIIVPKAKKFNRNVEKYYCSTSGYKNDLDVTRSVILDTFPEYCYAYDTFLKEKKIHCYNMFVMNRKMFNEYCEWLFTILFLVEQRLNMQHKGEDNRNGYYKRVYGFLAERLFNVYILHNNSDVIEYPVNFVGNKPTLRLRVINKFKKFKDKYSIR